MEPITTISDLRAYIDGEVQDGILVLTASLNVPPTLSQFLATLPARRIRLSNTVIEVSEPMTTLTITGDVDEAWPIRGTQNEHVQVQHITLTFVEGDNDLSVDVRAEGTLTVGESVLSMQGMLTDANHMVFTLNEPTDRSISLTQIANFISHNRLAAYLPLGEDLFTNVPVSALQVSLGFQRSSVIRLTFDSTINADWSIIDDLVVLRNVDIILTTTYNYQRGFGFVEQISGVIQARWFIEQDFDVRIILQGQHAWEVEIIPADGNILPGLATLADLAGGESLQQTVQNGLDALGIDAISLDDVRVGFNLPARTLRSIRMQGHLTLEDLRFNVQVALPDFAFHGSLSSETPIHLNDLIGRYFTGADAFPEIDITTFRIGAQPTLGEYTFYASIESDWTLQIGRVALGFNEFDIDITRRPSGVTGSIAGLFMLAGATFDVRAEHPDAESGWIFDGSTNYGPPIALGALIEDIARIFDVDSHLPTPFADLIIDQLEVRFDTATRDFRFSGETSFPIDDQVVGMIITIELQHQEDTYRRTIGGRLTIGSLQFDIHVVQDTTSDTFVATYQHTGDAQTIRIKELVESISTTTASYIPEDLEIDLKDVLFAYRRQEGRSVFLFGLDISTGLNLSHLPLIGQQFPPDRTISVDDLQILVLGTPLTSQDVMAVNELIPMGVTRLSVPAPMQNTTPPPQSVLDSGLHVAAQMQFGGNTEVLALPVMDESTATPAPMPIPNTATVVTSDNAKWFKIQKSFGPVHFERVGVQYQDAVLRFLLDAALSAAGLTLGLNGLSFGSRLDRFDPQFDLRGLSVDYRSGDAFELGGALLRVEVERDGERFDEYDGEAILKTEVLTLAALGSYTRLQGHPSLFVYAILDYPLGGPAFFFVTGLTAGFGYNRALIAPDINQVADFPLVAVAAETAPATDLTTTLNQLRQFVPPSVGDVFLAVGLKFTSFKMIDSFALLTVAFGNRFELNVFGLSTLVVPTPEVGQIVTPLAEVQMVLKASFIPDEGFLGVQAQLTSASYILSRDCHLTGGFAFFSWFSGPFAGDFVQTLGGYHPRFAIPEHYPLVPRLGFNWMVDRHLSLKGNAYYALTASVLMAGGHLQALWHDGNLRAWFNAGADFLIAWKPYHYEARIRVDMGVSYTYHFFGTHHLTVDVGADLQIEGPDFAGKAHVQLSIISFDVTFGNRQRQRPQPISWDTFRTSFLPAEETVCGVSVQSGLIRKMSDDAQDLGVINPSNMVLVTNAVIPSNQAFLEPRGGSSVALDVDGANTDFGISSMALSSTNITSMHMLSVTRNGVAAEDEFRFVPILKDAPTGLWGQSLTPSVNGARFVEDTLAGFEVRPRNLPTPGETNTIAQNVLQFEPETIPDAYEWERLDVFVEGDFDEAERRQVIDTSFVDATTTAARDDLLRAFGLSPVMITLDESFADQFVVAPQVAA